MNAANEAEGGMGKKLRMSSQAPMGHLVGYYIVFQGLLTPVMGYPVEKYVILYPVLEI